MTAAGRARASFVQAGAVLLAAALGGCSWFGEAEEPPLPGERISVMLFERNLEPDPRIADLAVRLPQQWENVSWPQAGGESDHAMHHLAIPDQVREVWSIQIGDGGNDESPLMAPPVVSGGTVYTVDITYEVAAIDTETGKQRWRVKVDVPEEDEDAFGGGLAYADGRLYLSTGFAQVFALDAASGEVLWAQQVPGPVRAPPTLAEGRVFVITLDNQVFALDGQSGERSWSHAGFTEAAGLLGSASPAASGGTLIVPYSSGELFALRIENGREIWSDNLTAIRRVDALSALAHIRGRPVIDRGIVYAISHSGRMVAIDLRTGGRAWERNIGGLQMPWVAGDFLFVLTTEGEILAITRRGGRVRWVRRLPQWEDVEDKVDPITWVGPVLANDRLLVASNNGDVLSISPYTGDAMGRIELGDGVRMPPVVADGTLYFLTNAGELVAMR